MKQLVILLCIAALIFGIASPFFADVFAGSPLEAWFHLLPTAIDQWLWPEGEALMLALAMLVFTVQYLVLFAVAAATPPVILIVVDFLAGPWHRSGLMGPRRRRWIRFTADVHALVQGKILNEEPSEVVCSQSTPKRKMDTPANPS